MPSILDQLRSLQKAAYANGGSDPVTPGDFNGVGCAGGTADTFVVEWGDWIAAIVNAGPALLAVVDAARAFLASQQAYICADSNIPPSPTALRATLSALDVESGS